MRTMAKRTAATELNQDNWADDDPEEVGVFKKASPDEMASRPIKKARRRGVTGEAPALSVFKGFTGFGAKTDGESTTPSFSFMTSPQSNSNKAEGSKHTPTFSFTQKSPTDVSTSASAKLVSASKSESTESEKNTNKVYLANIKALNESVLQWVEKHLKINSFVNLIPVFDDYKKHFDELQRKYKDDKSEQENQVPKENQSDAVSTVADTATTKSFSFSFGKTTEEKPKFSFGMTTDSSQKPHSDNKPLFSFGGGQSSDGVKNTNSIVGSGMSSGFSFGSKKATGFSFSTTSETKVTTADNQESGKEEEEDTEEVKEVKEDIKDIKEEGAIYEKKVKLFYKKDDSYQDKGIGMLFLKPAGEKVQLLVRAFTSLGNILLNIILNKTIPTQRVGKNNVLIVCVPNPPTDPNSNAPVSMLIRVKTEEDANELFKVINDNKK